MSDPIDVSTCSLVAVKIGSATLLDPADGGIRHRWLDGFVDEVVDARRRGCSFLVVSSGALSLGRGVLAGASEAAPDGADPVAGAVGQIEISAAWQRSFDRHGVVLGQLLLSPAEVAAGRADRVLEEMLATGVVPYVNENIPLLDEYDADRLAARLAGRLGAELLILLTDVDGLFASDPTSEPSARHIPFSPGVTDDLRALAGPAQSGVGTGGMSSKIEAAAVATQGGCSTVIMSGREELPLEALRRGVRHTLIAAGGTQTGPAGAS